MKRSSCVSWLVVMMAVFASARLVPLSSVLVGLDYVSGHLEVIDLAANNTVPVGNIGTLCAPSSGVGAIFLSCSSQGDSQFGNERLAVVTIDQNYAFNTIMNKTLRYPHLQFMQRYVGSTKSLSPRFAVGGQFVFSVDVPSGKTHTLTQVNDNSDLIAVAFDNHQTLFIMTVEGNEDQSASYNLMSINVTDGKHNGNSLSFQLPFPNNTRPPFGAYDLHYSSKRGILYLISTNSPNEPPVSQLWELDVNAQQVILKGTINDCWLYNTVHDPVTDTIYGYTEVYRVVEGIYSVSWSASELGVKFTPFEGGEYLQLAFLH